MATVIDFKTRKMVCENDVASEIEAIQRRNEMAANDLKHFLVSAHEIGAEVSQGFFVAPLRDGRYMMVDMAGRELAPYHFEALQALGRQCGVEL